MLRSLSYINSGLVVCYFLAYLQNGGALIIAGLLGAIVFNWLILRRLEGFNANRLPEILFAAITFGLSCWLLYGAVIQLSDAIDYQYFPLNVIVLCGFSMVLSVLLLYHLVLSGRDYLLKKDE